MTVGELRAALEGLPDDLPVHVNDVSNGEYHEDGLDPFYFEGDAQDEPALVIMVGVDV